MKTRIKVERERERAFGLNIESTSQCDENIINNEFGLLKLKRANVLGKKFLGEYNQPRYMVNKFNQPNR